MNEGELETHYNSQIKLLELTEGNLIDKIKLIRSLHEVYQKVVRLRK